MLASDSDYNSPKDTLAKQATESQIAADCKEEKTPMPADREMKTPQEKSK